MKSWEEILAKHEGDPAAAAVELVRRFRETDDFVVVARKWTDWAAAQGPFVELPSKAQGKLHAAKAAHALLVEATRGAPPLDEWTRRAHQRIYMWGARQEDDNYTDSLLSLVLAAWPKRKAWRELPAYLEGLVAAGKLPAATAHMAALHFPDYPDIAYALLGKPRYVPPAEGACYGCSKHPRGWGDSCSSHLSLLLERKRNGYGPDPRDKDLFRVLPSGALLREPSLLRGFREWLQADLPPPAILVDALEQALLDRGADDWSTAVALLCAWPGQQERAVRLLADEVQRATEPESPVRSLAAEDNKHRSFWLGRGAFFGRGWGRKHRARRLLPLSSALLERGVWPKETLNTLLQPPFGWHDDRPRNHNPDDDPERAHEWQREVLAEALLSFALDGDRGAALRTAALNAIERLAPGGSGSWARALSKIETPFELSVLAKGVRKALSVKRAGLTDAELAIEDALEDFFAAREAAEPGGDR